MYEESVPGEGREPRLNRIYPSGEGGQSPSKKTSTSKDTFPGFALFIKKVSTPFKIGNGKVPFQRPPLIEILTFSKILRQVCFPPAIIPLTRMKGSLNVENRSKSIQQACLGLTLGIVLAFGIVAATAREGKGDVSPQKLETVNRSNSKEAVSVPLRNETPKDRTKTTSVPLSPEQQEEIRRLRAEVDDLERTITGNKTIAEKMRFAKETRSEERRVGKECRSRWSPYH